MTRYEVLHYPGDVVDDAPTGSLLGHDEFERPYAVIDADYQHGHTTVHLGYATPEQIQAAMRDRLDAIGRVPSFAAFRPAGI